MLGIGPVRHGKHVTVGVFGKDREYDSFNDFVHNEPELAGMIVAVVSIVFLSPVLVIALILWYRMRKNRMLNETMLKLAEKGVVPPARSPGHPRRQRDGLDGSAPVGGSRSTSRRSRSVAASPRPICARGSSWQGSVSGSPSTRCSTTARPTGWGSCCCSSGSVTSCSGGSRTGRSRRAAAARPTRPRPRLPAGRMDRRKRMIRATGWRQPAVTDAQLIARVVVHDDRHAFSELVRRHQSAVRATLRRLTAGNHALADDLAQDTFMLAYRNLKSFRQEAQFSTWLYRIATNAFLADARKRKEELLGDRDAEHRRGRRRRGAGRSDGGDPTPGRDAAKSTGAGAGRAVGRASGPRSSSATIMTCRTRKPRTCSIARSAR